MMWLLPKVAVFTAQSGGHDALYCLISSTRLQIPVGGKLSRGSGPLSKASRVRLELSRITLNIQDAEPQATMAKVDPKAVNIWSARVIPLVLMGAVGYATYVLVARLCGESFLSSYPAPQGLHERDMR